MEGIWIVIFFLILRLLVPAALTLLVGEIVRSRTPRFVARR